MYETIKKSYGNVTTNMQIFLFTLQLFWKFQKFAFSPRDSGVAPNQNNSHNFWNLTDFLLGFSDDTNHNSIGFRTF